MKYDAYTIGQRAYKIRNNKNIKQREISELLNIGQSTYSRFENGQYDMPLSQVIKLCDYLCVSIAWLVGEKSLPQLTDSERLELEQYKKFIISKRNK